jgi:hypothetical protein
MNYFDADGEMNYFDADGEPLGHWEPTTREAYWEIVGPDHAGLTVYASYTQTGVRTETEWGLDDGETPVARTVFLGCNYSRPCSGEHRYYRWVTAAVAS